jgi:hypothetical protein
LSVTDPSSPTLSAYRSVGPSSRGAGLTSPTNPLPAKVAHGLALVLGVAGDPPEVGTTALPVAVAANEGDADQAVDADAGTDARDPQAAATRTRAIKALTGNTVRRDMDSRLCLVVPPTP